MHYEFTIFYKRHWNLKLLSAIHYNFRLSTTENWQKIYEHH